ncbi:hypothetical protein BD410DRAFT_748188 [Rickenella mellea]|uniref:MARVEL domain-containing protein n=1 Tax=Rickenella mellea TaxID=50990 RepID=A0A4Y7Q4K7_9AGAM|nr:hypothetical protein BD410DRAFT_748188 [Rickenella mellea]
MSSKYSAFGRTRLFAMGALFVINIIVLALSARVNKFQEFFFMADLLPLGLSISTLILIFVSLLIDFALPDSFTSKPPFEIGLLSILAIFWLAFNAFSTARWRFIPMACSNIPNEFADEKLWCRDIQALKSFMWIEWLLIMSIVAFTLRYVITQASQGHKHIWSTSLSRYSPNSSGALSSADFDYDTRGPRDPFGHASTFWGERSANGTPAPPQWEKFDRAR